MQDYLLNQCKNCRVEILGYASDVGSNEASRNVELSSLRAENVKKWLLTNVLTTPPLMDRVSIKEPEGLGSDVGCKKLIEKEYGSISNYNKKRVGNYKKSLNDKYPCKEDRYVEVKFVVDPNLKALENPKTPETNTPTPVPDIPLSRFYNECDYFEKLEQSSPIAYNSIKEKIKYFQPAFHSTTPEGFNARLNFLQQCMRQGPTLGGGVTNNPNNLAFGRPPVCILRIGDFYNTKIIIENLNFTFEPLVWDLNPEGVGVQPMICNVDLSFSFIGGSSLRGPINRLQNAVSFNYFANTEIYDDRADTIIVKDGKNVIKLGITGSTSVVIASKDITGLSQKTEPVKDQVVENANANSADATQPITPPAEPAEKEKKYPGFDEKSGTYTTQSAQTLKYGGEDPTEWSPDVLIPKGTKVFIGKGSGNESDNGKKVYINNSQNPTKKKLKNGKVVSDANHIFKNLVFLDCKDSKIWVERLVGEKLDTYISYIRTNPYTNNTFTKILVDIFCKNNKIKTSDEMKKFNNTK